MAATVGEIMNPELFTLREQDSVSDALHYLVALGISGAPVIGAAGRLVGFVSWRDLLASEEGATIAERMTAPADSVPGDALISHAARRMCDDNRHHLVVVDDDGRPVGFVGSLDVLRGLRGDPVPHPAAFPHWDPRTGLPWSNEERLDIEAVTRVAPDGPGLYVLIQSHVGVANRIVWSEATTDVRERLLEFLTVPLKAPPHLAKPIERRQLLFRTARAPSVHALRSALRRDA